MRTSVKLFNFDGSVKCHIPRNKALQLVDDGFADPVNHLHPRDLQCGVKFRNKNPRMKGQELALFEAGILKRISYVQGGLNRTEHQPFDRFKNS